MLAYVYLVVTPLGIPGKIFDDVQEKVVDLVNLLQSFIDLIQDAFLDLADAYLRCMYLLIKGIVGGDAESIGQFFKTFFEMMGGILVDFIEEAAKMLLREGSPLHFICEIVDYLVDALCKVLQVKWIPIGMDIHCGGESPTKEEPDKGECSWWPFNGRRGGKAIKHGKDQVHHQSDSNDNKKYDTVGERGPESEFDRINTETGRKYALIETTKPNATTYVGTLTPDYPANARQRTGIQTNEASYLGQKGYVEMQTVDPVLVEAKRKYIESMAPEPKAMPWHFAPRGSFYCDYGRNTEPDECRYLCRDLASQAGHTTDWEDNRFIASRTKQSGYKCGGAAPGCTCNTASNTIKDGHFLQTHYQNEWK